MLNPLNPENGLFFHRSNKNMELRALVAEHILGQFRSRHLDFHCSNPHERYNQLLSRCPGIVEHLPLRSTSGRFVRQRTSRRRCSPESARTCCFTTAKKNSFGAQE